MTYEIQKPLYENETAICGTIRSGIIMQAHAKREPLIVKIGEWNKIFPDPRWIFRNCESFEQEGKYADRPMKLYKIIINKETPEQKAEKERALLMEAMK